MALITRVSRLFQADLHDVLDRFEEPVVLLRQAIREMEEALAQDERRFKALSRERGQLTTRETELEYFLQEMEQQLDICFESEKNDLAKVLIRRKLEAQRYCQFICRKKDALEKTLSSLKDRLVENRGRLDSMRQKAELLAEDDPAEQPEDNWAAPDFAVRDEDVEVAFLREQQNRSRL
jgi:phage shock protein A